MKTEKRVTLKQDTGFMFPDSCTECGLEVTDNNGDLRCLLEWEYTDRSQSKRPDWCPLEKCEVVINE